MNQIERNKIRSAISTAGVSAYDHRACSSAKADVQANLNGRTHYVSDDTLKWFKARVIRATVVAAGAGYLMVESVEHPNAGRVRRVCLFDVNGTCDRVGGNDNYLSPSAAEKLFRDEIVRLERFDAAVSFLNEGLGEMQRQMESKLRYVNTAIAELNEGVN